MIMVTRYTESQRTHSTGIHLQHSLRTMRSLWRQSGSIPESSVSAVHAVQGVFGQLHTSHWHVARRSGPQIRWHWFTRRTGRCTSKHFLCQVLSIGYKNSSLFFFNRYRLIMWPSASRDVHSLQYFLHLLVNFTSFWWSVIYYYFGVNFCARKNIIAKCVLSIFV
jgi:hypothetical protein